MIDLNEKNFQFYCKDHDYGWSVNGDGENLGCPSCQETEHTPGPWIQRKWRIHSKTTVTVNDNSFITGVRVIADCDTEANACLIAAAPDLLEACRHLLHAFQKSNLATEMPLLLKMAADVIAKAEGKLLTRESESPEWRRR